MVPSSGLHLAEIRHRVAAVRLRSVHRVQEGHQVDDSLALHSST